MSDEEFDDLEELLKIENNKVINIVGISDVIISKKN